jgi:hypothetical protein
MVKEGRKIQTFVFINAIRYLTTPTGVMAVCKGYKNSIIDMNPENLCEL